MVRARSARNRATPTQSIVRVIRESDPNTSGIGPRNAIPPHRRVGAKPSAPPPAAHLSGTAPGPPGPGREGGEGPTKNHRGLGNQGVPAPPELATNSNGESDPSPER